MFFQENLKTFIFLIAFTLVAIFLYRFDYLDKSLSIPYDLTESSMEVVASDAVVASEERKINGEGISVNCRLDNPVVYNWCGVAVKFKGEGLASGIDLTGYDNVHFEVTYNSPMVNPKIKVTLRNFHFNYSNTTDSNSLKFNTVFLNTDKYTGETEVPLNIFQVENWWLAQYDIDFKDSQSDLSNVSRIEFLSYDMPMAGDYVITINNVYFKGELITANDLFKLIISVWLVVCAILLFNQHKKLKKISDSDALTGHLNRRGIQRKLKAIPAQYEVSLFYININEFKKVNDTYGHNVGDSFLIYFAQYLFKKSKEFNGVSYLSRFSGDEFLIVFENISHEKMQALAHSITLELKEPIVIGSYSISITASLGVAKTTNVKKNFDTLLVHAGAAMYHVKNNQLQSFQEFDKPFSKHLYFKKKVSESIKEALVNDDFYLNYMPIYDLRGLEVVSFEVLLRSKSKNMEGIGPDVFIPIAEEYNLIRSIDLWVIENTFKNIRDNFTFLKDYPVKFCINMSSEELRNPIFKGNLEKLLTRYKIPPEWIELELTETCFVETDKKSIEVLNDIRSLGVKLSLDDFGTGYISFNQLVHYPVDSLKIDKSFIDMLKTESQSSEMIIRAILSMAESYNLDTVAEGVETPEQYAYLLKLGCNLVQGYLFSEPVAWSAAKNIILESNVDNLRKLVTPNRH